MPTMGRYCKAYHVERFRQYPGWTENLQNLRVDKQVVNGKEVETQRTITDSDHFYLQENYVVTDGIFKDTNIIFDNVTPEWIDFCQDSLKFEIPAYAQTATE